MGHTGFAAIDEFVPTMQTIVVDKKILIEVLQENRATHISEYKTAIDGYQKAVLDHLTKALKAAKNGDYEAWRTHLQVPQSYEQSYDLAIRKMELSNHGTVHLSDAEFQQYVMDEWQWTHSHKSSAAFYTS